VPLNAAKLPLKPATPRCKAKGNHPLLPNKKNVGSLLEMSAFHVLH
jgi:hypothetical protein